MSDKYSPNLSRHEMETLLREQDVGHLAVCVNDEPYCIPLNYAYLNGEIVFHCALEGKKLDLLRTNSRVCFVVDRHPDPLQPHRGDEKCHCAFESVVCHGQARVLETAAERQPYLQRFQEHFNRRLGRPVEESPVTMKRAERCGCVIIALQTMSGRRKD